MARTFQNIRLFSTCPSRTTCKIGLHNQVKEGMWSSMFRLPAYWSAEKQMHERALELLDVFDMRI